MLSYQARITVDMFAVAIDEREASLLHGTLDPVSARIGSKLLSCLLRWATVCHKRTMAYRAGISRWSGVAG
ncbi:uncharacterized protein GLRG_10158 [Colletotrichum graminicola M1.001]|uniref:Uncharacterized protein n=1 Tax=Colletotrichum graminicola (strain M1.001 / M2 / FGSC 10212) TaxID=645133 RepID=E3QVX6_COLGM|nr:uncharacterized protein GLRG_10158 [Colletotrichum graminicola M1.001]EFQ35014.1 hypothetical protein GLRG_10158 [Colletotrichum graminicola M1.001]